MIEHVDPWAITIAVVCAPLVAVAISGVLDVVGRRSHTPGLRSRAGDRPVATVSAQLHDPLVSPDLPASSFSTDDQA